MVGARIADTSSDFNVGKVYVYEKDGSNEVIIDGDQASAQLGWYVAIGTG